MPRVKGMDLTRSELLSVGRLVRVRTTDTFGIVDADFDSSERVFSFLVPSDSRTERIYLCQIDYDTAECACGCEAMRDFLNASKMPYRKDAAGTYAEHLAKHKGKSLAPMITRRPSGMCSHLRRARAWVTRHGLMPHLREREALLASRLEGMEDARRSA